MKLQDDEVRVGQLDPPPRVVGHLAELQIDVQQLAEDLVRYRGHLPLHRQQLLFLVAERVRSIAQDPLDHQSIVADRRVGQQPLHRGRRNRHDFGTDVRRLTGSARREAPRVARFRNRPSIRCARSFP